jgi:oligoribonuclease
MKDKNMIPTKLLWVDLEMTGLDATKDVILEIAAEITDFDCNPIASYQARIKQSKEVVIERMKENKWWQQYPKYRNSFVDNLDNGIDLGVAEQELLTLVKDHFGAEPAILAGNSIHSDRAFIKSHWPKLDSRLHYRMLDVSSFKILMQGKYKYVFEKDSSHRAFDDIQASIAELQDYIKRFKEIA